MMSAVSQNGLWNYAVLRYQYNFDATKKRTARIIVQYQLRAYDENVFRKR